MDRTGIIGTVTAMGCIRIGHNADADADKEGEAREGGDLGEYEDLIGRGGDDTVDAVGGLCIWGAEGQGKGLDIERPPPRPSPRPSLIYHQQEE